MPATFEGVHTSTAVTSSADTDGDLTVACTVPAAANLAIICWGIGNSAGDGGGSAQAITAMTFNGVACVDSGIVVHENNNTFGFLELWYIQNPTSGNLVITSPANGADILCNVVYYSGAGTPVGFTSAFGASSPYTINQTAQTDGIAAAFYGAGAPNFQSAGTPNRTKRFGGDLNSFSAGGNIGYQDMVGTGSSAALSWTAPSPDWWAAIALEIPAILVINGHLQLEDGTGNILLEDGTGALVSEDFIGSSVSKDLSAVWDVRAAVSDDLQAIWDVRANASQSIALSWDLREALGDPISLSWDVRSAIGDDLVIAWDVIGPIAKDLGIVWDVRGTIGDTLQTLWDIRSEVGRAAVLIWDLRAVLGDNLDVAWDVRSPVGDVLSLNWDVRAVLGDSISLVWDARAATGQSLSVVWDVQTNTLFATKDLTLLWQVSGPIGKDLALRWDTREILGDSCAVAWDVRAVVSDLLSLLWDVRSVAGNSRSLLWDVRATAGDDLTALWNAKALVADDLTIIWNVESLTAPAQYMLEALVLERWGTEVAGVPNRWKTEVLDRWRMEVTDE